MFTDDDSRQPCMDPLLRDEYIDYLRRLREQAEATVAELEDELEAAAGNATRVLVINAETTKRIVAQFRAVKRDLDQLFVDHEERRKGVQDVPDRSA